MLADKMRTMELAANYQSPIPASKSYNYVYPYTTENIGEYMPVVKGKSILKKDLKLPLFLILNRKGKDD